MSNTKAMENIGWEGICIEPNPDAFDKLCKNKRSYNFNVALSDKSGTATYTKITGYGQMLSGLTDKYCTEHKERINKETQEHYSIVENIKVVTITFKELMNKIPSVKDIDFISLDTEGSEFEIIKPIDFNKYDIKTLAVENNYDEDNVRQYMKIKGYQYIKCKFDDIFIKK